VHVYSPPLRTMTHYRLRRDAQLEILRTEHSTPREPARRSPVVVLVFDPVR
jgi:hypothetical protein